MAEVTEQRRERSKFDRWIAVSTLAVMIVGGLGTAGGIFYAFGAASSKIDALGDRIGKIEIGLSQSVQDLRSEIGRQASRIDEMYRPRAGGQ